MKLLSILITGLLLAGCATTKQGMSEDTYEYFSQGYSNLIQCSEAGKIDAATTAQGFTLLNQRVASYNHYPERLKAFIELKRSEGIVVSDTECNRAAVAIQSQAQKNITYNQVVQNKQEFKIEPPKHTICNQVGTQTMCTTY